MMRVASERWPRVRAYPLLAAVKHVNLAVDLYLFVD